MYDSGVSATVSGVPLTSDPSSALPALGSQVDDPVRRLDHIQVVLDDEHRVPSVNQAVKHIEQEPDVLEV